MCARPKGSKNKPKTLSSFKELKEVVDEGVKEAESSVIKTQRLIDREPPSGKRIKIGNEDDKPFLPDNFDVMSKVEKLQWLTANRK